MKYYGQLIDQLNTSLKDIKASRERSIQIDHCSVSYLNAIITGNESEHRIMFYGKNVMPENYTGEKMKQIMDVATEMTEDIKIEGLKFLTRVGLGGLAIAGVCSQPQIFQSIMDDFVYKLDKKEFWGKLDKSETTIIKIPKSKWIK